MHSLQSASLNTLGAILTPSGLMTLSFIGCICVSASAVSRVRRMTRKHFEHRMSSLFVLTQLWSQGALALSLAVVSPITITKRLNEPSINSNIVVEVECLTSIEH